jgi:hypothetical protein
MKGGGDVGVYVTTGGVDGKVAMQVGWYLTECSCCNKHGLGGPTANGNGMDKLAVMTAPGQTSLSQCCPVPRCCARLASALAYG